MEMLGRPRNRPALLNNAAREQQPATRGQYGISVDHEGLLFAEVKW